MELFLYMMDAIYLVNILLIGWKYVCLKIHIIKTILNEK